VAKQPTRANFDAIRDHLFNRIHQTGEQLKNNFPNILRRAIEAEAWTHFTDSEGKPFTNLVDWLHYTFPNGASMGQGKDAITYEDALKLTEGASDVHRVLLESAPKGKRGPKPKGELNSLTNLIPNRSGAKKVRLGIRLAQEKPKILDGLKSGKYKTITEAATAAGFLKPNGRLRMAKSAFRNMSDDERAEFLEWLKSPEAKDPIKNSSKK
jgi:hypothetical protein